MKYIKKFEKTYSNELFFAVECDDIALIEVLIYSGADINCTNYINNTPLIAAAYNNKIEIVKLLIEAGADLNIQNNDGHTALIFASIFGYIELVKLLIDAGANLNIHNIHHQQRDTALTVAAYRQNIEVIKLLIKAGADWNFKNDENKYFLDYLDDKDKNEIEKLDPEKYNEYLMKKNAEKYNL